MDREFYQGADEFYQGPQEDWADREVYRTGELNVMGQQGRGEYLSDNVGEKRRERGEARPHSFYKNIRRMWQLAAASCCVTVIAAAIPQSQAVKKPAATVQSERASEEAEAVEAAAVPVETTVAEAIPEEKEEAGQPDTLELTADEIAFLESLRAAMESEDMGAIEAVVVDSRFGQMANKFRYLDLENERQYFETYVYTDGAAKRMGLADGECLSIALMDRAAFVLLGNISNSTADSFGRYFYYNDGNGLIERILYRGYFAASQAEGEGELTSTIEFTNGNTRGDHSSSYTGVFKDGFLYSGTMAEDYYDSAVFHMTVEDGVIVQSVTTDETGSYDGGNTGEPARDYQMPVEVMLLTNMECEPY